MKEKTLFYSSCIVVSYFAMLFINAYGWKSNSPVFSFLQESLTIPMLILQGILLGITLYKIAIKRVRSWQVKTALALLVLTSVFTYGSLFGIIKISMSR